MAEQKRDDEGEPIIVRGLIYHAPHRMTLDDGSLGPEYGPRSPAAQVKELREFLQSRAGGGLWDESLEFPAGVADAKMRSHEERHDLEAATIFYKRHWRQLTPREREVFGFYWLKRLSRSQCAGEMRVQRSTVEFLIKEVRKKVRAWWERPSKNGK